MDELLEGNLIFIACYYDDLELLNKYLENNSNMLVNNDYNNTPLHIAIQFASPSFCEILIRYGADINARNKLNITPLYLAAKKNRIDNIKMLIKYGVNPTTISFFERDNALDIMKQNNNIMGTYILECWINKWKSMMNYRPLRIMVGYNDILRTEIELGIKKEDTLLYWSKVNEADKKIGELVNKDICFYCCNNFTNQKVICSECNICVYCSEDCRQNDLFKHKKYCNIIKENDK